MQVGDLVKYNQTEGILVVVAMRDKQNQVMIRCFCPHLQDYYWFWEDNLEVIHESR